MAKTIGSHGRLIARFGVRDAQASFLEKRKRRSEDERCFVLSRCVSKKSFRRGEVRHLSERESLGSLGDFK